MHCNSALLFSFLACVAAQAPDNPIAFEEGVLNDWENDIEKSDIDYDKAFYSDDENYNSISTITTTDHTKSTDGSTITDFYGFTQTSSTIGDKVEGSGNKQVFDNNKENNGIINDALPDNSQKEFSNIDNGQININNVLNKLKNELNNGGNFNLDNIGVDNTVDSIKQNDDFSDNNQKEFPNTDFGQAQLNNILNEFDNGANKLVSDNIALNDTFLNYNQNEDTNIAQTGNNNEQNTEQFDDDNEKNNNSLVADQNNDGFSSTDNNEVTKENDNISNIQNTNNHKEYTEGDNIKENDGINKNNLSLKEQQEEEKAEAIQKWTDSIIQQLERRQTYLEKLKRKYGITRKCDAPLCSLTCVLRKKLLGYCTSLNNCICV